MVGGCYTIPNYILLYHTIPCYIAPYCTVLYGPWLPEDLSSEAPSLHDSALLPHRLPLLGFSQGYLRPLWGR